jgi:Uma2 family endonuclease
MAETGGLRPGERFEVIECEIIVMVAIGSRQAGCVNSLTHLLITGLGDRAVIAVQNPVRLSDISEPQPDLAVLRPRPDRYSDSHPGPGDVLLITEVAHASSGIDRGVKAQLYARTGIPEYWLVDLDARRMEVLRRPRGGEYDELRIVGPGDRIASLAFPELELKAEEFIR